MLFAYLFVFSFAIGSIQADIQCGPLYVIAKDGLCDVLNCERITNHKCEQCLLGYTLQTDGTCRASACSQWTDNGQCVLDKCFIGFKSLNGICQPTNCEKIGNDGFCVKDTCSSGYTITASGGCIKSSDTNAADNCQLDSNGKPYMDANNHCTVCQNGYSPGSNGICNPYVTMNSYKVKDGDTCIKIADALGVNYQVFMASNAKVVNSDCTNLQIDSYVMIPYASANPKK